MIEFSAKKNIFEFVNMLFISMFTVRKFGLNFLVNSNLNK